MHMHNVHVCIQVDVHHHPPNHDDVRASQTIATISIHVM